MRGPRWSLPAGLVLSLALPATGLARDWEKIPPAEMGLTEVAFAPGSVAVMLLNRGRLVFNDRAVSSFLEIHRRVKVLKEEGKPYGTISIPSNDYHRLKELKARTILPDGREVPLPKDAKFTKEDSVYYDTEVTSFALPEVVPGAIVEYSYKIFFDSLLYQRPWYFPGELPALRSEVTVVVPGALGFSFHHIGPKGSKPVEPVEKRAAGVIELTFAVENLVAIPDEPWRPPFEDLATGVVFLPRSIKGWKLLEDWPSVIDILQGTPESNYGSARRNDGGAKSKGKELAAGSTGPRATVERLHLFVRDSIETIPWSGVWGSEARIDEVLSAGRGAEVNKALLLQAMLRGAGIEAYLGWTTPRTSGTISRAIPNPAQMEKVLVVAEVEGQRLFLDPSDQRAAFGTLAPQLEGATCLLIDKNPRSPEWLTLPETPARDSGRKVTVQLALDADGRFAGVGTLNLTGHWAWARLDWRGTREETARAWFDWLVAAWPGYEITDVEVKEDRDARRVEVGWKVAQRVEDVVGDEATLAVAAPLAIGANPFTLPAAQRRTPVHLRFTSVDEAEVTVTWPEGWALDHALRLQGVTNWAGALEVGAEVDEAGRRLVFRRRFEVKKREAAFVGYDFLRALYQAAVTADAERLALVRQ